MKKLVVAAVLAAVVMSGAGCYKTKEGRYRAGMPFSKDTIESRYERPVEQVYESARATLAFNGSITKQNDSARVLEAKVNNRTVWVRVDEAEAEAHACMVANADGALRLAQACHARDLPFVGYSSDLVFDGRSDRPYRESDGLAPLSVYGASKARAEAEILALRGSALMIRTAAFFSAFDPHNFAANVIRTLAAGHEVTAAEDLMISPTYVPDLVDATLDLLIDGETGLRHLANRGAVTWADFARMLAAELDLDPGLVRGAPVESFGWPAARPAYAALGTERGWVMPTLANAIARYGATVRHAQFASEAEALADGGRPDLFARPGARAR